MVTRRPELFAAYVGTGQVASWRATVQAQFDVMLAKARADNDTIGLKELQEIGRPDPSNASQYFEFSKGLFPAMPAPDQEWLQSLRASTSTSLGVDEKDFRDLIEGMKFTAPRVLPDQMATDLLTTATDIRTPFFLIQGRDDVTAPTTAAVAYFNRVEGADKGAHCDRWSGSLRLHDSSCRMSGRPEHKGTPVAVSGGAQDRSQD